MIDFLKDISTWAAWLGIGGIVGFVLLLFFAPAVARVIGAALEAPARAIGEGVVWFVRDVLWVGLKDMLDNWASITFVIVAIFVGAALMCPQKNCDKTVQVALKAQMDKLRGEFKFVPLTPAEKKARAKQKRQAEPCWYCLW
jgi:hypothetical protein